MGLWGYIFFGFLLLWLVGTFLLFVFADYPEPEPDTRTHMQKAFDELKAGERARYLDTAQMYYQASAAHFQAALVLGEDPPPELQKKWGGSYGSG